MSSFDLLMQFEMKSPFLYDIEVNGVPVYTTIRETVCRVLLSDNQIHDSISTEKKGKIYFGRIIDSIYKINKHKKAETLIFTSSTYRRDKGRNLAAEYLAEKYPSAIIYEWPSRIDASDKAYFKDEQRTQYCPLDYIVLISKLYRWIHKRKYNEYISTCRKELVQMFSQMQGLYSDADSAIIDCIVEELPKEYALIAISQFVYQKKFRKYKHVRYAIDFWGGARENIFPILPGKPMWIELQHGIIDNTHLGYIYPQYLRNDMKPFFQRTMLVYGENTKKILSEHSIFKSEQIQVIGNPRLVLYRKLFSQEHVEKNMVLFTSQPYEQDKKGVRYYETVLPFLKEAEKYASNHDLLFAIKIHPRENADIKDFYLKVFPSATVYDNSGELYEILNKTLIHITANSTVLYEATTFDAPTITIRYAEYETKEIFGEDVYEAQSPKELVGYLCLLENGEDYNNYLLYLKKITNEFM